MIRGRSRDVVGEFPGSFRSYFIKRQAPDLIEFCAS
jgi:hypothetical protein